jgi:Ion channel
MQTQKGNQYEWIVAIAIALAFCLVAASFFFHYRCLLWLGENVSQLGSQSQAGVLMIILSLFCAHIVEIALYALGYAGLVELLGLGSFNGASIDEPLGYLYYSGVIFTSLGLGDIYPDGHIRFVTFIEALNGFMLVTWSASFTFLAMGRLWPDVCCSKDRIS